MSSICFECCKVVGLHETKGSLKLPFCAPCFEKKFDGSEERYREALAKHLAGLPC